jgi:hypothetical protein
MGHGLMEQSRWKKDPKGSVGMGRNYQILIPLIFILLKLV